MGSELFSLKSWEDRLTRTTQLLSGVTKYSDKEVSQAAASLYHKLVAADKYKPSAQFKGQVLLVRAKDNYVQMGDDYGLSAVRFFST